MRRALILPILLLAPTLATGGVETGNPTNNLRPTQIQQLRPWSLARPWWTLGPPAGLHATLWPGAERPGRALPCVTVSLADTDLLALGDCDQPSDAAAPAR